MAGLPESSFSSVVDFLFWIPLKDDNFYFVFTFIWATFHLGFYNIIIRGTK